MTGVTSSPPRRGTRCRRGRLRKRQADPIDAPVTAPSGRPRVATIGGGTGHYHLLTGLRLLNVETSAIVTMMDSGGSSGRLRDEYGILPPGDFTRCLIALSSHPEAMKELLGHRFVGGSLDAHTVRNVIFAALEQITGDTVLTIERLHEVFAVEGRVIPVTLDRVELVVHLENGRVFRGEASIDGLADILEAPVRGVALDPPAEAYPGALEALEAADVIVIGPGDLYTSIVPNLLVTGVRGAIQRSRARVVYICNLMTKRNETPDYTVGDFTATIERYLGAPRLDAVLFNDHWPTAQVALYASVGSRPVIPEPRQSARAGLPLVARDVLHEGRYIRHDSAKLAEELADIAGLSPLLSRA
ncbi:MAG: YvcK family protein [Chloroflexota bacterium]|nr:MAG: YvcK family protein [Chloroflexota bacterium]